MMHCNIVFVAPDPRNPRISMLGSDLKLTVLRDPPLQTIRMIGSRKVKVVVKKKGVAKKWGKPSNLCIM